MFDKAFFVQMEELKMFKNAKKLKKLHKEIVFSNQYMQKNELGEDILKVHIEDEGDLLSKYCVQDHPTLNEELCVFIEEKIDYRQMQNDLNIELSLNSLNEEKKTSYQQAFLNTYTDKIIDKTKELHRNKWMSIIFLLTGIIVFIGTICLKKLLNRDIIVLFESLDIMGWVFIWEAVDLFFIARKVMLFQQIRYYKILKAKFSFKKE